PTESVPSVVGPSPALGTAVASVSAGAAPCELLAPTTDTALPDTVTGAFNPTTACVPEPAPSEPEVVAAVGVVVDPAAGEALGLADCDESPTSETALPPRLTGEMTLTTPWVPDSSPSSPEVSAALATVA